MSTLLNHTIRRTEANNKFVASFVAAALLIFTLFGAATDAADKSGKDGQAMHDMNKMDKREKTTKVFTATDEVTVMAISDKARTALSPVYDLYFAVQTALAVDEFDLAVKKYKQLDSSLTLVDMILFKGEAHMKWMTFAERLADVDVHRARATLRRMYGPVRARPEGREVNLEIENGGLETAVLKAAGATASYLVAGARL